MKIQFRETKYTNEVTFIFGPGWQCWVTVNSFPEPVVDYATGAVRWSTGEHRHFQLF